MTDNLTRYGADGRYYAQALLYPELTLARVTGQGKSIYRIITNESDEILNAEVSGKFRHEAKEACDYPAVGDYVMVQLFSGGESALIHRVLPRKTVFERRGAGKTPFIQVIAANIDYVFICMALNSDYNLSRLERYLTAVYDSGAMPIVVLTKTDLCEDIQSVLNEVNTAAPLCDIVTTGADDENSYKKLIGYIKEGVTVSFVGSSGVGKTTLINRLLGGEELTVGDIGKDGKGRHTTTSREMILLPDGGVVIDTPGMRELGIESGQTAMAFPEIEELSAECRFSDCTHTNEPGCAVLQAVADGVLDERRYSSYIKLKREVSYDGLNSRQLEEKKLNEMLKDKGGMKNMRKYIRDNDKRKK